MSGLKGIKGVFFDLYGTLLIYGDMEAAWDEWLSEFYRQMKTAGLVISVDKFSQRCEGFFSGRDPASSGGLTPFEIRIKDFAETNRISPDKRKLKDIADRTVSVWQQYVSVDPEAAEVLRTIKLTKKTAMISNFDHPPHVYDLLSDFGLIDLLDVIVVSGETGYKKPDPEIFDLALNRTGLSAEEVIFVGDAEVDVEGSKNAGMIPVLLQRPGYADKHECARDYRSGVDDKEWTVSKKMEGTRTIESLSEILDL